MGVLQAIVSVVPAARRLLGTTPLKPVDLLIIAGGVLVPLLLNEVTKPAAPKQVSMGKVINPDKTMNQELESKQEIAA